MDTLEIVIVVIVMAFGFLLLYDVHLFTTWIKDIGEEIDPGEALCRLKGREGDVRRRPLGSVYLKARSILCR